MSMMLIKQLMERRAALWTQLTGLLDAAEAEGRAALTAEEEQTYQRLNADVDALDARVRQLVEAQERAASEQDILARIGDPGPDARGDSTVMDELRAVLRGESAGVDIRRAETFRALSHTPAAGGATVPTSFYGQLVEHMIESSAILAAGPTVLETDGGEPIEIPKTLTYSTGTLTAENATIPTSEPTFAKATLSSYKYAHLMLVPTELIDDTGVDLEGFLARQAGRAVGNAFGAHLVTGSGTNQPQGLATAATVGVTAAAGTAGAITADGLIDLMYSVISPYRASRSAAFLVRDQTLAAIRKLKDSTGQYLWQPSIQAGTPDMLLGKPVYTDPNVAAVGTSARSVLFGDISAYWVRLVGGVRFERSSDFKFDTDAVAMRCIIRGDGLLADTTGAVKAYVGAAT